MTILATRLQAMAAMAILVVLAGCDSDNDNNNGDAATPTPAPTPVVGTVEVIHASADAPPVNVLFDDVELVSGADFKDVATLSLDISDSIRVRVDGIIGGSTEATVIPAAPDPEPTFPLGEGDRVSIIAWDSVTDIKPLVLIDNDPIVDPDTVRLRVIHAAPGVPGLPMAGDTAVEVWLTEPGADLSAPPASTINAVFQLGEVLAGGPIEVPAGDYQIRATLPGDETVIAYDSGTVTLAGGTNLVVLAVPNTNAASASPISLLVATGADPLELQSADTQSNVRVVHASSDAPEVGVLVDGADSGIRATFPTDPPLGPVALDPGLTTLGIGLLPDPAAAPVVSLTAGLIQGGSRLAVAIGSADPAADPANAIRLIAPQDSVRSIATDAQVRIIHGSVIAQDVNIYVLPENTLMMAADIPAGIDPTFANVPFGEVLGHISLPPGNYDIAVTPATSRTPAIGPFLSFPLPGGSISTIIAIDGPNLTTPLDALVIDDTL